MFMLCLRSLSALALRPMFGVCFQLYKFTLCVCVCAMFHSKLFSGCVCVSVFVLIVSLQSIWAIASMNRQLHFRGMKPVKYWIQKLQKCLYFQFGVTCLHFLLSYVYFHLLLSLVSKSRFPPDASCVCVWVRKNINVSKCNLVCWSENVCTCIYKFVIAVWFIREHSE